MAITDSKGYSYSQWVYINSTLSNSKMFPLSTATLDHKIHGSPLFMFTHLLRHAFLTSAHAHRRICRHVTAILSAFSYSDTAIDVRNSHDSDMSTVLNRIVSSSCHHPMLTIHNCTSYYQSLRVTIGSAL